MRALLGMVTGNPWVSVILLVVLIGSGFSAGVWLESLIKNAEISKQKLDAQTLQTQLAQARADATTAVEQKERELNVRQANVETWYKQQLVLKDQAHERSIVQIRNFSHEHAKDDFVLP